MTTPDGFYNKELVIGTPQQRKQGQVVDWRQFDGVPSGLTAFASLNYFDDEMVEHYQKIGSVKGFSGPCWCDALFLDVDGDGETTEQKIRTAAQQVLDFALYLKTEHDFDLRHIWFSGWKGFHVAIAGDAFGGFEPSATLPHQQKAVAVELANRAGIQIDTSLYNSTRLFRLPNTLHETSKRYKVPVTLQQVAEVASAR